MALDRDSALLTTKAEVVAQTSVQDLGNLESDAEFSVADVLLEAHRWVYDRLKRRFGAAALATLTNQVELKRAVAFRFLELVSAGGYLGDAGARAAEAGGRSYWGEQAREEVDEFQPEFSDSTDEPRRSDEGVPRVANLSRYPRLGSRSYFDDLPTQR